MRYCPSGEDSCLEQLYIFSVSGVEIGISCFFKCITCWIARAFPTSMRILPFIRPMLSQDTLDRIICLYCWYSMVSWLIRVWFCPRFCTSFIFGKMISVFRPFLAFVGPVVSLVLTAGNRLASTKSIRCPIVPVGVDKQLSVQKIGQRLS